MKVPATARREEKSVLRTSTLFSSRHETASVFSLLGRSAAGRPGKTDRILNRFFVLSAVAILLFGFVGGAPATTIIPIGDSELYRRADLIVYGIVVSSETVEDPAGQPDTVTTIRPVRVAKGWLEGDLTIHQAGGVLPDGRFFKLWGRPEYTPGHEVVVFAIARPEGDYQTAEMLLGKFEVESDESGRLFAVPELARGQHPGVAIERLPAPGDGPDRDEPLARYLPAPARPVTTTEAWNDSPRDLAKFLDFLDAGGATPLEASPAPVGKLSAVARATEHSRLTPQWGNINGSMWRYSNGATAAWKLVGTANMTGGGVAEATNAIATWDNDPNSTINYSMNSNASNQIQMSATSSPCGWSTCVDINGGVVGCGGPNGGGSNTWLGESYTTITGGTVWLRCYATTDVFGSVLTQSFLTHELGHTLGLAHPDQTVSPRDACRGDENLAIMRSMAQNRTTLGTDDQDAIRWLYGDGGNHCSGSNSPSISGVTPPSGTIAGGTLVTISGAYFQSGATISIGGNPATGVTFVNASTLTGFTPAHATGSVSVVVTNPDAQSATRVNAFQYVDGTGYFAIAPCRVLDTRNANGPLGGPVLSGDGAKRVFVIAGSCGISPSAKAVSANLTVTGGSTSGTLVVFPGNVTPSGTSTLSFPAGATRANNATLTLSTDGSGSIIVENDATGTVQLIVDVNGYYQ